MQILTDASLFLGNSTQNFTLQSTPLCDVTNQAGEEPKLINRIDRQISMKDGAVLFPTTDLTPRSNNAGFSGFQIATYVAIMVFTVRKRV